MKYRAGFFALMGLSLVGAGNGSAQNAPAAANSAANAAVVFQGAAAVPEDPLTVWYRQPAARWVEALPLGNGRLGAMVYGGVPREHIQLNEDTIWNGQKRDRVNPEAAKYLPEVRRLLFEGKPGEAVKLADQKLMGIPNRQPPYQPLGDLFLNFPEEDQVADYKRELNLSTGIATVSYRIGEAHFTREIFISAPDQAVVVRITCDQPNHISVSAALSREQDSETKVVQPDRLVLTGEARAHKSIWISPNQTATQSAADRAQLETNGVKFRAVLRASVEGGSMTAVDGDHDNIFPLTPALSPNGGEGEEQHSGRSRKGLYITNANAVTLLLVAATDYRGDDPEAVCQRQLARATKSFEALRKAQIADHQSLFNRVALHLGDATAEKDAAALPIDERLARYRSGTNDAGLPALYFQFGRYLLMDCSRPGCMAATLQGIWNDKMAPNWDSKYTININTEMNYWPAEVGNLPETQEALFDLIRQNLESGRRTAREMYGCRGFCFHHNLDAWGDTAPVDYAYCGTWPMGGAWLSLHFWEHYRFGMDKKFLRKEAYPVMKEAAEFLQDFLVDDGKGHLVTNPSYSPENNYKMADGTVGSLTVGATMDYEIIRDLFNACIQASEILDTDAKFRADLAATLKRIPDFKIGKYGQLQEWSEDYDEPAPGMGHVSHMFAVYPGDVITLHGTPELATAARASMQRRVDHGGGKGGFPAAWYASIWARLGSGDDAYRHLHSLLGGGRGASTSLLNGGNVFQIDANLGATAAIAEMLLQSHEGDISILPALPAAWPEGQFKGLRARGGVTVDLDWSQGRATSAKLRALEAGEQRLRLPNGQRIASVQVEGQDVPVKEEADGTFSFRVRPKQEYSVMFL